MEMVDATHSSLTAIETRLSVGKGPHSYSSVSAARLARYSQETVLGGCCGGIDLRNVKYVRSGSFLGYVQLHAIPKEAPPRSDQKNQKHTKLIPREKLELD